MNDELLKTILDISQQMIEVGAEVHRVEDSIIRICNAYDVSRVDVYVTTFNIIVSVENHDGSVFTNTRRITQTSTNIEYLHKLNSLARKIVAERLSIQDIKTELSNIKQTPIYSDAVVVLFYGVIACSFSVFFGARTIGEIITSLFIGLLVGVFSKLMEQLKFNKLFSKFLCSFFAAISAFICLKLGIIPEVDKVIIGNIMSLIPGIGLTNSLRDLFTGDSITAVLRLIEAILLALCIACGYIVTVYLFGGIL